MTIGENIRRLRELHELTQRELGAIAGVSDKAVSTWENGAKMPRMTAIKRMAAYFGIPAGDLLEEEKTAVSAANTPFAGALSTLCLSWGRTPEQLASDLKLSLHRFQQLSAGIPPTEEEAALITSYFRSPRTVLRDGTSPQMLDPSNVRPIHLFPAARRIPVLGRVPAGVPIEAVTDVIEEIDLSGHSVQDGYDYFGLLVTGDSMFPEYLDGDIVILRVQQTAETGDDVVAYIGNSDATLKRLTVTENGIQLRPLNPAYETRSFSNDEIRTLPVTIAGIVIEQRRTRRRG